MAKKKAKQTSSSGSSTRSTKTKRATRSSKASKSSKSAAKKKSTARSSKSRSKKKSKAKETDFVEFPSEVESLKIRLLPVPQAVAVARARMVVMQEFESLKKQPGFQFVDVGYKFSNESKMDDIALRLHVDGKLDVDSKKGLPETYLDGLLPTDVIISTFLNAGTTDAGAKIRSDGTPQTEFGTLGMGVDGDSFGNGFFLTCAHVVSSSTSTANAVYDITDVQGTTVARASRRNPRFFRYDDYVDAAVLAPHRSISDADLGVFRRFLPPDVTPPNQVTDVEDSDLDLPVYKIGAETGVTWGYIDSVHPTPVPIVDTSLSAIDHFLVRSESDPARRLSASRSFARGGDSGAIVCTQDGRILGIVRAVLDYNADDVVDRTVVTRMANVMAAMPFIPR